MRRFIFLFLVLYSNNTIKMLMIKATKSITNRKDNFSYPSDFSFNGGLHVWLPEYLFLSKSRFPVVSSLLISWLKILVKWEPFFITIEACWVGRRVSHTGLNWKQITSFKIPVKYHFYFFIYIIFLILPNRLICTHKLCQNQRMQNQQIWHFLVYLGYFEYLCPKN